MMAEVACEHSDKVIFTSDNPRSEDPAQIIKDMEEGIQAVQQKENISRSWTGKKRSKQRSVWQNRRYHTDSRKRT